MYTKPLTAVVLGLVFLLFGIILFLKEYKASITQKRRSRIVLIINVISLLLSIGLTGIGTAMFLQIYNQLN
ncbi:hypothetical protein UAK_00607 [Enterococcus raffinosus ATCC 49464]|uniref:Uncharacterized protein n=1 Tax=Enterococcus raffinosus ATCC 49464 TaxID=1158602 RepID=R2RP72_9ENTE|nr:hypothetical protein UAK_00607 [Enterococcus raffinosus ATCC 49464]OFP10344.1 hypothetical protein HMPREF3001_01880 [Enterococcus sp. HMSC066C04]OFT86864.1 hypothetical protein HMPREF3100_09450 [Enterococcus sp. HMSC29A04]OFU62272.1 hypothetical protein HMPREF3128_13320 [Enterococcus sp. HMSC14A10]SAM76505.1 hypothetical protein DTPHA_1405347 [Enterococcus faecium]